MNTEEHFIQLREALKLELKHEQEQFKLFNENAPIKERVSAGISLYPLEFLRLHYTDFGDLVIECAVNPLQEGSSFSEGSTVSFFNGDGETADGQCLYYRNDLIKVKVSEESIRDWIKNGKIGLNALVDTKTYDLFDKTLKRLLENEKIPLLNDFYQIKHQERSEDSYSNTSLNESQNKAVNEILSDNSISILHGPPGTGKTTTIVAAITEIVKEGKKILLCTPSNTAVDNVCGKLISKKINVVRLGNEAKINAEVSPAYLENKIRTDRSYKLLSQLKIQADKYREQAFKFKRNFGKDEYEERKRLKAELKSIRSDIRKVQNDITSTIIKEAQVIAGTFYSVQRIAEKLAPFDYVIIDEGGQAIEPAIWSVAHFGKQLIVAGDDLQLPPTVKSQKAKKLGLDKSILQIASEISFPKQLLNVQYRMNETIMGFSNAYFYNGRLIADNSVAKRKVENNVHKALEFIDTAGCGFEEVKDEEGGGITNPGEVRIVEQLISEYIPELNSLGIITPYRAQLNEINNNIENPEIVANTVDSFQGQERDVIIISLVRSNELGDIGFLKDYRRMNVAMTRAKLKLVIIGDSATIGQDSFYGDFLDYVETNGTYRSAWEFNT